MATKAGLLEMLGKPGHYTLFAPTNKAFSELDKEVLDRLMGNKDVLNGKFQNTWKCCLRQSLKSKKIKYGVSI